MPLWKSLLPKKSFIYIIYQHSSYLKSVVCEICFKMFSDFGCVSLKWLQFEANSMLSQVKVKVQGILHESLVRIARLSWIELLKALTRLYFRAEWSNFMKENNLHVTSSLWIHARGGAMALLQTECSFVLCCSKSLNKLCPIRRLELQQIIELHCTLYLCNYAKKMSKDN